MALRSTKPDFDLSQELEFEEQAPQLRNAAPRLRPDADIVPQTFRGKTYFVLKDPVTLQFYRVRDVEREILNQLDGHTTLGDIHDRLRAKYGPETPSFRELARFTYMLRHANLTVGEGGEETHWAVERATKKRNQELKQKFSNFMYLTIPLLDPERFLSAAMPYVRWAFGWPAFAVWLLAIGGALFAFFYNAPELADHANKVLDPSNLVLLYLGFALVKVCHEFGHAFTAKHLGAEVHRMGIMFMIFMPVLYVDATSIWAFPRKWPKVLVGAAGMMVELFVASLALFGWLLLEPCTLRTILYNMIFVASVSTVLFNGNPLLRYDAYYILADLIEIPNLRQRSNDYLKYLFKRHLIGDRVPINTDSHREKVWYVTYGIASAIYRCFVVVGILFFIASRLFFLGVALSLVVACIWVLVPLGKLLKYIFFDKATRPVRLRAIGVFAVLAGTVGFLVAGVPLTSSVRAPCALEPLDEDVVRAEWPGFLSKVNVGDGQHVTKGQVLAVLSNEELDFRLLSKGLDARQSEARVRRLEMEDQAAAQAERFNLQTLQKDVAALRERKDALTIRAPFDGKVIAPDLDRISGRFVKLGDAILTVASLEKLRVTAVLDNADVPAVRSEPVSSVRMRFGSNPDTTFTGTVDRVEPSATIEAPPPALANTAGGPVLLDPNASSEQPRALMPWYRVDIVLDAGQQSPPAGATGTVRFVVGKNAVGQQVWLHFRRLLHRRFLI
jgi:putative peptide zinc metalloprotease protein